MKYIKISFTFPFTSFNALLENLKLHVACIVSLLDRAALSHQIVLLALECASPSELTLLTYGVDVTRDPHPQKLHESRTQLFCPLLTTQHLEPRVCAPHHRKGRTRPAGLGLTPRRPARLLTSRFECALFLENSSSLSNCSLHTHACPRMGWCWV